MVFIDHFYEVSDHERYGLDAFELLLGSQLLSAWGKKYRFNFIWSSLMYSSWMLRNYRYRLSSCNLLYRFYYSCRDYCLGLDSPTNSIYIIII